MSTDTIEIEAEMAVLACMFINLVALDRAVAGLTHEMFASPANAILFEAAVNLKAAGEPVNRLTCRRQLQIMGRETEVGLEYLASITELFPVAENITAYIGLVREAWLKRSAVQLARELQVQLGEARDYAGPIIRDFGSRIAAIGGDDLEADPRHYTDIAIEAEDFQIDRGTESARDWPWYDLSNRLGPLIGDQFIVIGGLSSHGKTHAACQIALHGAVTGVPTKFYSFEMDTTRLVQRLNWIYTGLNPRRMQFEQRPMWIAGYDRMKGLPLYLTSDSRLGDFGALLTDIELSARRLKAKRFFIDYWRFVRHRGFKPTEIQGAILEMGAELKSLAKRIGVDIFMLHQVNKSTGSKKQRPTIYDLEYGGDRDADIVLLVHQPGKVYALDDFKGDRSAYEKAVPYDGYTQFIVGKNRNGDTDILRYGFDKNVGQFAPEGSMIGV